MSCEKKVLVKNKQETAQVGATRKMNCILDAKLNALAEIFPTLFLQCDDIEENASIFTSFVFSLLLISQVS